MFSTLYRIWYELSSACRIPSDLSSVNVSLIAILILDALTNGLCSALYILEPVVPDDAPTVLVLLVLLPLVTNHPILHCLLYALLADSAIRVTDGCCQPREAFGLPFYPLEAPAYLI